MWIALALVGVIILVWVLDILNVVNMSHPITVPLTALLLPSVSVLALCQLLSGAGSWYYILTLLVTFLFQVYLLIKTCLRPLGMKKAQPPRKAAKRILLCGLILGAPVQFLTIGSILATIVATAQNIETAGILASLWLAWHLVPPLMLLGWSLDIFIVAALVLINMLWLTQAILLFAGTIWGVTQLPKDWGKRIAYLLLSIVLWDRRFASVLSPEEITQRL